MSARLDLERPCCNICCARIRIFPYRQLNHTLIIPLYRNREKFGDIGKEENIRRVLEAMYKQSADFLDTDIHGIKFDIDRLTNELFVEGRHSIADIISALSEKNALGEGKQRWGDKTPYYVLHMKTLLEMFPSAQFIHLIRDGRDCALSMFERKHDFRVYNTFFAAKYWEIYVDGGRRMGRELGDKIYHEVRYEDLLDRSETTLQGLCSFLNEPYSDNILNFKKSGQAPPPCYKNHCKQIIRLSGEAR